jgi:naphthalene 1,2-dioxygenase system ferredoxin subunit
MQQSAFWIVIVSADPSFGDRSRGAVMKQLNWVRVAALAELPADDAFGVVVQGRELAIYRVAGEVFATDNRCTHGEALLSEGFLMDYCIECPLHQGQFDVRTGEALCAPVTVAIRTYPARIEGEDVLVDLGV